jgi:hypothetical protein
MKGKILAASLILSFTATTAMGALQMKEGLWEISTTMEMPGMPFQPPATTIKHCYTKEEVQDQKTVVPSQDKNCKISDMKTIGNKVTWKMVCTGDNAAKGEGEMTFKGDTAYSGVMKFSSEGMNMTSRYSAKRLGPCK